jgi:NADP-dependent 3-hydroxy acid dehydrogenase YdfG
LGAGPGVGLETANFFGKNGYSVGLMRRNEAALQKSVIDLKREGVTAYYEVMDANDSNQVFEAVSKLIKKLGHVDVLLYNIPGPLSQAYGPISNLKLGVLQQFLQTRILSALSAVQAALPSLVKVHGAVMFTSGQSDRQAFPNTASMGIAQAGLHMMAKHLFNELKQKSVFVGYLPLDNPPLYKDKHLEEHRTDLPQGFSLPERVSSTNVAQTIYELNVNRNTFEKAVHSTINIKD